ncbi:MAG: efflux RND transporter permease subunit [Bacteroidetes bacterium]|jgi:CzcA family heavy metal efflux pump|nr:efflux RND transporter permease subunit [Bacteroidota bacterium]
MRPWNLAIDNSVAVYIMLLLIVIVGFISYTSMPREAAPDISIPIIIVNVPYPGVSPADIEGLVVQQLERDLQSLADVKQITSVSKEGMGTVRVEFNTGVDIDEALRRVRDKVSSAKPSLPNDILEPIVSEINISEFPIMYVNVGGDVGLARLKKIAEDLQDQVEAIPGVLRADLNGGLQPEIQVNCDVYRLKAYQIGFEDVVNAIRGENLSIPGGSIDDGSQSFSVRVPGEFKEVRPIEDIVIKIQNSKPIYVRDVAQIEFSFEDTRTMARLNGVDVVSLQVRKRAGENLIRIADEVHKIVKAEQVTIPAGIQLSVSNDQSKNIKRSVEELENSIFTGMFLVVVALFMFFGLKNSLLISTAIPISMLIGFMVQSALGITLNFVVLFALVLVLGIVVDDAIVVIENIYRHQQIYHKSPVQAARDGVAEVAVPVLTSTLSTLSPFIPLLFWPGVVGDFMWYLPMTLITTLGASLFVAMVISPVQGAKWIDYKKEIAKAKLALEHPTWWRKHNPITKVYHFTDEKMFPWMQEIYATTLRWALGHKWKTIGGAFGLLVVAFVLTALFGTGIEFFPTTDPQMVNVRIEAPPGTALEVTDALTLEVERRLNGVSGRQDVEFLTSSVGSSDDMFDFGGQGTSNKAGLGVNFHEKAVRMQSSTTTVEEIRKAVQVMPGADIRVVKQEMGPPVGAAVSIEIAGDDYAQLAEISRDVRGTIRDIPGLVDLKDDYNPAKPEIAVVVDREKAGLLWTSTSQIAGTIRSAITGTEASKYRVGEDEYKIRVRLREDQRSSVNDLSNINVSFMNRRGQMLSIPVVAVADIQRSASVSEIRRKDLKRVITVSGNVEGRVASEVLDDVKARLESKSLPAGYSVRFTGKDEEQNKAMVFLGRAFLFTILLVFLTLVMEFNSIKVPIVIMLTVPLALVGVLFGLLVTRMPFSVIMTGVGVIALVGIVVKNAIVLLDFVKQKRDEGGMTLDEALVEAGKTRLRPVMLTAATTVLGVVPLATGFDFNWRELHFVIGAESAGFWGPLGVAIISGLTLSSFLTLVVVPVVYSKVEETADALHRWVSRIRGKDVAGA